MTFIADQEKKTKIFYPSEDGEPMAETYANLYAIITILGVLKQYLAGQQATVLANQYLYYSQGFPKMRVAPDVMVIFNVSPGGRDNYKIWEKGETPTVIFEVTSPSTQEQDQQFKKTLYEQLGVLEYWLFDPKGEWIREKLRGYRLVEEEYQLVTDFRSQPLKLKLQVEGELVGFYREDNGEKLLIPEELAAKLREKEINLQQEILAKQEVERKLQEEILAKQQLEDLLTKYRQQFGEID